MAGLGTAQLERRITFREHPNNRINPITPIGTLGSLASTVLGEETNVAVRIIVDDSGINRVLHVGQLNQTDYSLSSEGEFIRYTSRIPEWWYGDKLNKARFVWRDATIDPDEENLEIWESGEPEEDPPPEEETPETFRELYLTNGLTFNPVDKHARCLPNRFKLFTPDEYGGFRMTDLRTLKEKSVLEDQQAIQDLPGPNLRDFTPAKFVTYWTLSEMVSFMCWTLNPNEEWIVNPLMEEMSILDLVDPGKGLARNLHVRNGVSLGQALTQILEPYDFGWIAEPQESVSQDKLKIRIVNNRSALTANDSVTLPMQAIGETLDVDETRVKSMKLQMRAESRSANRIVAIGAPNEIEVSVTLRPAWSKDHDDIYQDEDVESLQKNSDAWQKDPGLQVAWRKYAANEGGDYTHLREGADQLWFFAHEFSHATSGGRADTAMVRRRQIKPTLTMSENGRPAGAARGFHIEYWDPDKEAWYPVVGGDTAKKGVISAQDIQVLDDEIAVLINSDFPPSRFWGIYEQHGMANLKLRITGRIQVDTPIVSIASTDSFTGGYKTAVLSEMDRFKVKSRDLLSYYVELVDGDVEEDIILYADERDDIDELDAYAEEIINSNSGATISGPVVLEGSDNFAWADDIGKVVLGLSGRELDFIRSPTEYIFPNIASITFDFISEETTLNLTTL